MTSNKFQPTILPGEERGNSQGAERYWTSADFRPSTGSVLISPRPFVLSQFYL